MWVFLLAILPIICVTGSTEIDAVIIGSGLAGQSAVARLLESGVNDFLLLEKNPKFGGNSAKATSGMNAADSNSDFNSFIMDTLKSATGKRSKDQYYHPKVEHLVKNSRKALKWLKDDIGVDLSAEPLQLGGHSKPRTNRIPKGPVGWTITKSVHEANVKNGAKYQFNSRVTGMSREEDGSFIVSFTRIDSGEKASIKAKVVIVAAGGYGNDHEEDSLLKEFGSEEVKEIATTNGPWATGDLVKILRRDINVKLQDMDQIQVHPTGLVDPKDLESKSKILAPEALRGVGGLLLNREGRRFVDELGRRDHVVEQIRKQKAPIWLVLNGQAADKFGRNFDFYLKKRLFTKFEDGFEEFAKRTTHVNKDDVWESLGEYHQAAGGLKDDDFGKTVFPELYDPQDRIYVAQVTPVIHYTMGGVEVNKHAEVLSAETGEPIPGLFAAGEVTGGVHGKNRLGGNSLLECVVYGRTAGEKAAAFLKQSEAGVKDEL